MARKRRGQGTEAGVLSQARDPPGSGAPHNAQDIPQGWQSTKLDTSFL